MPTNSNGSTGKVVSTNNYQPGVYGGYGSTAYGGNYGGGNTNNTPPPSSGSGNYGDYGTTPPATTPPTVTPTDPTASQTPATPDPTTQQPPASPTTSGSGSNTAAGAGNSGFWDNLLNSITGGSGGLANLGSNLGSALGSLAPYLGIGALAQNQANKQRDANAQTVQPLYDKANQLFDAMNKDLGNYEAGTVNPAQQKELDAFQAQQKAQVAQRFASQGITNSSATDTAFQQIDDNTMIMKQQFVTQSLTNALALEGPAMSALQQAITETLNSDTALSNQMTQLFGTLAMAWAKSQATTAGNAQQKQQQQTQPKASGGGGSGGGGGGKGGAGNGAGGYKPVTNPLFPGNNNTNPFGYNGDYSVTPPPSYSGGGSTAYGGSYGGGYSSYTPTSSGSANYGGGYGG